MSNRNIILAAAGGAAPTGYQISRSLRFNSADSAYLSKAFAANSDATKATLSFWHKRSVLATEQQFYQGRDSTVNNNNRFFVSNFQDNIYIRGYDSSANLDLNLITTAVYRDVSSWYHILVVLDTTQATSSDRAKLYINGELVTSFSSSTYPSLNQTFRVANSVNNAIGHTPGGSAYLNGYLAEYHFLDGVAASVTDFGETDATTGVWSPIAYAGTYGTNGFYLDFSDNTSTTTLGYDAAGSNDWTLNNFSVTAGAGNDSLVDTPTPYGTDTGAGGEVRGNYATWNPLINGDSAANGNLDVTNDTARSTQSLLQFDTYWEITSTGGTTTAGTVSATGTTNTTTIADTKTYGFRLTTAGTLDYINITDGGSFTNITTGLTGQQFIYASAASATTGSLNTGQRPFAATAPSGFKALCTTNLPDPTVVQGDDYFNTVTYTGTGTTQSLTVGFQPDFIWFKGRSNINAHGLFDAVRGRAFGLASYSTSGETTSDPNRDLASFDLNGFTVDNPQNYNSTNASGQTLVAWNWNAGGSNATNTDGTITSTVRANPTAGFSIVSYTATGVNNDTVGHGLGVTPDFWIVKTRDASRNWLVYTQKIDGSMDFLNLNGTAAKSDSSANAPTSSVFSIYGSDINTAGEDCIAYVFAAIPGFSAFGKYTGNGSADGPFVYTGFRPAFVVFKVSSTTGNWKMVDSTRSAYNLTDDQLSPNLTNAESVDNGIDILSNGFKLRSTDTATNGSGQTFIYMAFAENPFKYSLAR